MPRILGTWLRRPVVLTGLLLLGLALCLLRQLPHAAAAPRLVSPLPLYAPGFTLETPDGMSMRIVPLAGWNLRSPATPSAVR